MKNQAFEFLKLFDDREKESYVEDLCINISENNKITIIYKAGGHFHSVQNNALSEFLFNIVFNQFSEYEKELCLFKHDFMGFKFDINKCKFNQNYSYIILCKEKPDNLYDIIDSHLSATEKKELLNIWSDKFDNKPNQRI